MGGDTALEALEWVAMKITSALFADKRTRFDRKERIGQRTDVNPAPKSRWTENQGSLLNKRQNAYYRYFEALHTPITIVPVRTLKRHICNLCLYLPERPNVPVHHTRRLRTFPEDEFSILRALPERRWVRSDPNQLEPRLRPNTHNISNPDVTSSSRPTTRLYS